MMGNDGPAFLAAKETALSSFLIFRQSANEKRKMKPERNRNAEEKLVLYHDDVAMS
jgi:hypothetical protein